MKILIVDDSREDRDLIITTIQKTKPGEKVLIDESNCLHDALSKIDLYTYDVMILDLALPESDGIETVKTIKKQLEKAHKNIPIIILTGIEDYKIGREIWSLGVKDYLIKNEVQEKDLSRALTFATSCNSRQSRRKSVSQF